MPASTFGCLGCGDDIKDSKGNRIAKVFFVSHWKDLKDITSKHKVLDYRIVHFSVFY